MTSDEVIYDCIVLLHADGKNDKVIFLVLFVGRPKLGGAGVASRSPGMHESDGYRLPTIVAEFNLFPVFTD